MRFGSARAVGLFSSPSRPISSSHFGMAIHVVASSSSSYSQLDCIRKGEEAVNESERTGCDNGTRNEAWAIEKNHLLDCISSLSSWTEVLVHFCRCLKNRQLFADEEIIDSPSNNQRLALSPGSRVPVEEPPCYLWSPLT